MSYSLKVAGENNRNIDMTDIQTEDKKKRENGETIEKLIM